MPLTELTLEGAGERRRQNNVEFSGYEDDGENACH